MKLQQLMQDYLDSSEKVESDDTIQKYLGAIKAFEKGLGRPAKVKDLTRDNIVRCMKRLTLANSTRNSYIRPIISMWKWAEYRIGSPAPKGIKFREDRKKPVAMTIEQMRDVLAAIRSYKSILPSGVPGCVFFEAVFHLMALNGGERISAVMQTKKKWVNLDKGTIEIPASARKGSQYKVYQLRADTLSAIKALYSSSRGELLFDSGLSRLALTSRWKTILKRAGLPADRRYTFHGLRRTCYSHASANGLNAKALFGHRADLSSRYEDPDIVNANKPFEAIEFAL